MLLEILPSRRIRKAYGLHPSFDYTQKWAVGTPDALTGVDALLAQVLIDPRTPAIADLEGNYADAGRYVVISSHNRLELEYHCSKECFDGEISRPWKRFKAVLESDTQILVTIKSTRVEQEPPSSNQTSTPPSRTKEQCLRCCC